MEAQATTIVYKGPAVLERAVLGLGLAGGLLASGLLPGYPNEWRALLPVAVLALALWSSIAAYLAAVAVLAYPIWQISPYLMVLFIAVAVIPHRLILDHLALALLVAWSPVLAAGHLDLAVPLLAGVFAGPRRGAVAGGLAALWLQVVAAASGNPLDLLAIHDLPGTPAAVAARFAGAGSLETLQLLGAPFAPNSGELLGHLLQIATLAIGGAAAGWLAGWGRAHLVIRDWEDPPPAWRRLAGRFYWTGLLPVALAAGVIGAGLLLVPVAVGRPLSALGLQQALNLLATKLSLGGAAVLVLTTFVALGQPLPARDRPARRAAAQPTTPKPAAAKPTAPKPAPPPVLPPVDLTPIRTGSFIPGWAAGAGLHTPLPPAAPEPGEADDLVDLLMQMQATLPAPGPASRGASAAGYSPAQGPVTAVPPARDIAIELD